MAKDVVINGELAEQARRLTGADSARDAAEAVLRDYVRGETAEKAENGEEKETRSKTQFDRIRESALAIARQGDPFYPGFNYKDLRKNRDFG